MQLSTPFLQKNLNALFIISVSVFIYSCAAHGKSESPMTYGYGFNTMPGIQVGTGNTSAHAVLGYARFPFKGGGGYNGFIQLGAQVRQKFDASATGLWAGVEATYLNINTSIDNNSSFKSTASGFTIGGIGGYRFQLGKVPLSIYLAPAYLNRGAFKTNGMTGGTSSSGFYGRLGFDIHFMSLLSDKGR